MSNLVRVEDERQWGLLSYVIPLAITLLSGFGWVASVGIWVYFRSRSRFVSAHAVQSIALFVLTLIIGSLAAIAFMTFILIPVGFVLIGLGLVTGVALPIYAAIQASRGRDYVAPLIGRAFRSLAR